MEVPDRNLIEFDRLKAQNETLMKENETKTVKIQNQTRNLHVAQNNLKTKNDVINKQKAKIAELEQIVNGYKINKENEVKNRASLRKKIGWLEKTIKQEDDNRFVLLGKIKMLEERLVVAQKTISELNITHDKEKRQLFDYYEKEKTDINDRLEEANEKLKQNMEADRSPKEIDEDLYRTCLDQLKHIESLKKKTDDTLIELRRSELETKEISYENLKVSDELKKVESEKKLLSEELNRLKSGNRNDLEDKTCLICTTEMNEEGNDFQCLPKCNKCRRRYHKDCISEWFDKKRECPVCKNGAWDMININSDSFIEENIKIRF